MTASTAASAQSLIPQRKPLIWRRLFHILAGSGTPILAIFVPTEVMVGLLTVLSALAVVLETARQFSRPLNRLLIRWLRPLLKNTEDRRPTGAAYMVVAALLSFVLFDKGFAIAALLFLSLGDPLAALTGVRARGPRLWSKSPVGTLAFFGAAAALGLVLWSADIASPLWALIAGGAVASLVELAPLPLDDNATIPLIAGGAMMLMTL